MYPGMTFWLCSPVAATALTSRKLRPHSLSQGFFYNRYKPPAEAKGELGTETGACKEQQVPPFCHMDCCSAA